jgi:hypothetical protein
MNDDGHQNQIRAGSELCKFVRREGDTIFGNRSRVLGTGMRWLLINVLLAEQGKRHEEKRGEQACRSEHGMIPGPEKGIELLRL